MLWKDYRTMESAHDFRKAIAENDEDGLQSAGDDLWDMISEPGLFIPYNVWHQIWNIYHKPTSGFRQSSPQWCMRTPPSLANTAESYGVMW